MLSDFTGADRVYIACGYTDLRRGIDGLTAMVQQQFVLNPFTNTLFLFCGRRRDRIKALYWEGNGFLLLYKRLESGSFQWPRSENEARAFTPQQYRWLMEGLSIDQPKAHEPGKAPQSDSFMWLYRTSGDTDKPIVLYEYQPGRGGKHSKEFLAGFGGYLHTDGYTGCHSLPKEITVVGRWAHARRKFDEAVKSLPKGKAKGSSASQGLAYCNLLFEIEQGLAEKTAEERYAERLKQAKPVLDALLAWANTRTAAPKSALGKAFTYLKEQWPYLTNYLKDGRLELSNNRAERSIKPFVIDRKNFLFANTPKGAKGSAIMFSLIQTAIENGLDPYKYLTWLLKTANTADMDDIEVVQSLLPWNAAAECIAYTK